MRFVYKLYDRDDVLLYVGSTGDVLHRLRDHRRSKPWFHRVWTVESTPYTYDQGWRVETRELQTNPGIYNVNASARCREAWVQRKARQQQAHDQGRWCNDAACAHCKHKAAAARAEAAS